MKILVPLLCLALVNCRKIYALSNKDLEKLERGSRSGRQDRYLLDTTDNLNQISYTAKIPDTTFWDPIDVLKNNEERKLQMNLDKNSNNIKDTKSDMMEIETMLKPLGKRSKRGLASSRQKQARIVKNSNTMVVSNHKNNSRKWKSNSKISKAHNTRKKRSLSYKKNLVRADKMIKQQNQQELNLESTPNSRIDQSSVISQPETTPILTSSYPNQETRNLNIVVGTDNINDPIGQPSNSFVNDEQMQVIQNMIKNSGSKKKVILKPSELKLLQSIAQENGPVTPQERDAAIAAGARACQSGQQQDVFYQILNQINGDLINQKMIATIASFAAIRMARTPKLKWNLKIKTIKGDLTASRAEYSMKITEKEARAENVIHLIDLLEKTLNDIGTGMSSKIRMLNAMVLKKFNSPEMDVMLLDAH